MKAEAAQAIQDLAEDPSPEGSVELPDPNWVTEDDADFIVGIRRERADSLKSTLHGNYFYYSSPPIRPPFHRTYVVLSAPPVRLL